MIAWHDRAGVRALTLALLLTAPLMLSPVSGSFHQTPIMSDVPDREVVLVMQGTSFNAMKHPDSPLLEAVVGEVVRVTVIVPALAEPHTFHMHGHPWLVRDTNQIVDTFLLKPGDVHVFDIIAGGPDRHTGDWMYHCHVDSHMAAGMWGVFRVYPFAVRLLDDVGPVFSVHIDGEGQHIDDASFTVALDGKPIDAMVMPLGHGRYQVNAPGLSGAVGQVTVTAHDAGLGDSVARASIGGASLAAPAFVANHTHA